MAGTRTGFGGLGPGRGKPAGPRSIDLSMRLSRIAPFFALALAAAAGVGAALASSSPDWRQPGVIVLHSLIAAVADRFQITTRSGVVIVGSLPIFVLTAALFGPAPGVAAAVWVTMTQPRKSR